MLLCKVEMENQVHEVLLAGQVDLVGKVTLEARAGQAIQDELVTRGLPGGRSVHFFILSLSCRTVFKPVLCIT